MKRVVVGSKQIGDVVYMCESLFAVRTILESKEIKMTNKKEKSLRTNKPEYFTSLTRNFKSLVAQNPTRWRDGIILDGTKLSDTYAIDSINFAGHNMMHQNSSRTGRFKIRQITKWPSRCMISFVGWSKELKISDSLYQDIYNACMYELPQSDKQRCHMELSQGKRKVNGEKFIERIRFNTPGGGPANIFKYLNDSSISEISQIVNQFEERVHGPVSKSESTSRRFSSRNAHTLPGPVVHIDDCVKGIVINSEDAATYPDILQSIEHVLHSQYDLKDYECIEYES